jgi:acetolactate synthase-1/2/3 large subunit
MRVADAIFERLKPETDAVFFIAGGGAMFLVDALGRSGLRAVSALHEQGAGAMALGYAMLTGRLGVCLTTAGPGATNAITPCLAAWTDSVPVLFISGQPRSDTLAGNSGLRSRGIQEAPIVEMVGPITKYARETGPDVALLELKIAIEQCLTGRRGPCWLSVPQDVQGATIDPEGAQT